MSRRPPNPAADRAAQNLATLKSLLKLEANKTCADCKRNKHPRWASWNLGVFVCIRCSGIHRGMGTHISRVKSVDLDSWTDEQMQSILSWGNARANKYFEAKLAPGHSPSEAKIENFIRTKYEMKRWAMDGPRPDPSTLDAEGDDDVPLNVVKEKQAVQRQTSTSASRPGQSLGPPPRGPPPEADLIGGDDPTPARASSAQSSATKSATKAEPAPPKTTNTKDSLLGLDFLGGGGAAPPRPASISNVTSPSVQSRPDLKQSILSLYASAPRPPPQPQQGAPSQQGSFGSMGSPRLGQQQQQQQQQQQGGFMGGLNDAFGNLSTTNTARSNPPAAADPFASLGSASSSSRTPQAASGGSFGGLGGGGFFDAKPVQNTTTTHKTQPSSSGFGDGGWGSFSSPSPGHNSGVTTAAPSKPAQSSAMGDLFDLSSPITQTTSPPPTMPTQSTQSSSVFNLTSAQTNKSQVPSPPKNTTATSSGFGMSGADVWGGNEWATAQPNANTSSPAPPMISPALPKPASNDFGWGNSGGSFASTPIVPGSTGGFNPVAPKVAADEEFGGWAGSAGPSATGKNAGQSKPSGALGGNDDLFSNVWE